MVAWVGEHIEKFQFTRAFLMKTIQLVQKIFFKQVQK